MFLESVKYFFFILPMGHIEQKLLTSVFSGVCVTWSLVIYVCFVDRCLYFCPFSFGHCVVCSSSIYGFWLPLWYLQTLLKLFPVVTQKPWISDQHTKHTIPFHTHFRVWIILFLEDSTMTMKCRRAIKALFLYFNLCLSIMLDSLSCSFTSMSFLTKYFWGLRKERFSQVCFQNIKLAMWQWHRHER